MTPSASMAHLILLVPPPMRSATIHYGTFEGGHRSRTRLGQSPQLNWRLPTISRELPKLRDSNKVPKASKAPRQPQPSRALQVPKRTSSRALQVPKSNKLLNLSLKRILVENSNRCNRCNGKNTRSAQILHSQIPPKQQMLWGEKRGRTKKNSTNESTRSRSNSFSSLRGEIDWWKDGSRSPLSFPFK